MLSSDTAPARQLTLSERARSGIDPDRLMRALTRLAPGLTLIWLGAFFIAPLVLIVVYSFANQTFGGVQLAFTWTNFAQALSGFYLHTFLHTIVFAVTGTLLCLVVGIPVAYTIGRKARKFTPVLLMLLLIPFWTSFLIRTLSIETIIDPGGPLQAVLNGLGLHHGTLNITDSNTAVFIGIVYGYLPLMTVPLLVAFQRIPISTTEASKDLGAGRLRTFASVTLPLARPGVVTAILLTFVPMTGEFVIPSILGGGKGLLMGGLIYSQFMATQDYPLGSAMAVLVLLVIGVSLVFLTRASKGFEGDII